MGRRRRKRRDARAPGAEERPAAPLVYREPFWRRHRDTLRAWGVFAVVFVGLMSLFLRWGGTIEHEACAWTARGTAWMLWLMGFGGRADGSIVYSSMYPVKIIFECTAVFPLMVFVAAVAAYPGGLRSKLGGLAAGIPLILLLNQGRVLSLVWIGHHYPHAFKTAHEVFWQSAMIFLTLLIWLLWAARVGGGREARTA